MRSFRQIDVFTAEFLSGNPLAVVHDADDLSTERMAEFANWTNLSETTFLLRPTDPAADYRVRIFTTSRELPFAGHPTLGSARAWLAAGGIAANDGVLVQECAAGLVRVRQDPGGRLAFAAPPLLRSGPVEPLVVDRVTRALGLIPGDVLDARWCDNGPGWVGLLLRDADTVLGVEPDFAALGEHGGEYGKVGIAGVHGPGSDLDLEVRALLAEGHVEDPVTGSLNAALAQWLIPAGVVAPRYIAAQGTAIGRRGRIHVQEQGDDIWVGGDTVVGIAGEVAL